MKYTPTHQKKPVSVAAWISFAVAAVMYLFSITGLPYTGLLQYIMLACLCTGAYVLIRYRFTSFTYEIRTRSCHSSAAYGDDVRILPADMVDLAVHRAQGKRENLEFLMSLDKLIEILRAEKDTVEKLRARYAGIKFYCYTVDMVKRRRTALVFDDEGDKYCIILESEDAMEAYLAGICRRNAESAEI